MLNCVPWVSEQMLDLHHCGGGEVAFLFSASGHRPLFFAEFPPGMIQAEPAHKGKLPKLHKTSFRQHTRKHLGGLPDKPSPLKSSSR